MRRTTAAFLISFSIFIATPSDPANGDRDFVSRIRSAIHRITRHIGSNGDLLTPPKP
jgi:hypothetical protein